MRPKFVPEEIKDEEVGAFMSALVKAKKEKKKDFTYNEKKYKITSSCEDVDESLWDNIHKRRKSGKRMRKPGEKGAPTAADFKRAKGESVSEATDLDEYKVPSNYAAMMAKKRKKAGTSEFGKSMNYVIYDKKTKEVYASSSKPFDKFKMDDVADDMKVKKSDLVMKKMRKGQKAGERLKEENNLTEFFELDRKNSTAKYGFLSKDQLSKFDSIAKKHGLRPNKFSKPEERKRGKKTYYTMTYTGKVDKLIAANAAGNKAFREEKTMEESTAAYAKSLEKIANDRKMKNLTKKDKETLIKIAQLMKRANEATEEISEAPLNENNNDKYKWGDINKALMASGLKPWQIASILRKLKGKKLKEADIKEKKLDPVNPKAADKFKNRKDKDIDNDGDVDDSDEYLHKRRKAIGKAMKKEGLSPRLSAMIDGCAIISDKEAFVKEFKLTEDSKYSEIYKAAKLFNK